MSRGTVAALVVLLAAGAVAAVEPARDAPREAARPGVSELNPPGPVTPAGPSLVYRVTASNARVNRRVTGPVRRSVQGVPAEPVDSFVWDGVGSVPVEGEMSIEVDPRSNTGRVSAWWKDRHGYWTYEQTRFVHPDFHPSGVRIGSSTQSVDTVLNEAMATNVYLHGDTTCGAPVLPTVYTYLGAWGRATVTLNGEPFVNPFEFPAPQWDAHVMVTEGVRRDDDGTVRLMTNEIFSLNRADEGAVDPYDLEAHITFHDRQFPLTSNLPPFFSFFYHVVFEDVTLEIVHTDPPAVPRPGRIEP